MVHRGAAGPVGEREDRCFATVFLGSGLLLVGMLLVAGAVAGGLVAGASSSGPPGAGTLALGRIARRTEIVSRWLTVAGLVSALVLLDGVGISAWVELLFPAWILALSLGILAAAQSLP